MQTIVGHFVSKATPPAAFDTLIVDLTDGDQLQLHIDFPPAGEDKSPASLQKDAIEKPVVLLMHGLGGCSESRYVLRIAAKLNALGYIAARFNHRGCGHGGLPLAKQIYHAGRTEDIRCSLAVLHQNWPSRNILLVSFSLSANMTLLMLGREPELATQMPRLRAALAVCPPIDLAACAEALARPDNKHIDYFYTKILLESAASRATAHPHVEHPRFPKRMTLRKFDELYTTTHGGFSSVGHYYKQCSSEHVLQDITVPTTIIAAADDPIIPKETLDRAKVSDKVAIFLQPGGGHMGFIAGTKTSFGDYRWLDESVISWVRHNDQTPHSKRGEHG